MKAAELIDRIKTRPLYVYVPASDMVDGDVAAYSTDRVGWSFLDNAWSNQMAGQIVRYDESNDRYVLSATEEQIATHNLLNARPRVVELPSVETDQQKADRFKAEMKPIAEALAALMTAAERDGMRIEFSINRDAFGRQVVQSVSVVKVL